MKAEPWYQPTGDECMLFEAAYARRLPVLLKGPTGCGKTRFVEHMAWRLGRPLITVACHDDLSASDLTGRWLLDAQGTRWQDGPLTTAVRSGAICYLDELSEARSDTTVVIHPLADSRRMLPLDKCNEQVDAHADFALVVSYNPAYAARHKALKPSTVQRFCGIEFGPPRRRSKRRSWPMKAVSIWRWRCDWSGSARAPGACRAMASTREPRPACWCMPVC